MSPPWGLTQGRSGQRRSINSKEQVQIRKRTIATV